MYDSARENVEVRTAEILSGNLKQVLSGFSSFERLSALIDNLGDEFMRGNGFSSEERKEVYAMLETHCNKKPEEPFQDEVRIIW